MKTDILPECLHKFGKLTRSPLKFLSIQDDICKDVKELTKLLYDFTKLEEKKSISDALRELIVNEFDEEQIWQEIEMQNNSRWDNFIESVALLTSNTHALQFPIKEKESIDVINDENNIESTSDAADTEISESTEIYSKYKRKKKKITVIQLKKEVKKSIVDDDFFKLNEMETFLEIEDKKEMAELNQKRKQQDSDEESVDLFEASDDVGDENSDDEDSKNYNIKYEDFFGVSSLEQNGYVDKKPTDSYSENEEDEIEEVIENIHDKESTQSENEPEYRNKNKRDSKKNRVRFDIADSEYDNNSGDDSEGGITYEETGNVDKPELEMTEYELRQKRLRDKIRKLEDKTLADKPWQMKGEVTAASRPQNSLLEEVLDFDMTTRPAPIITEETTFKLEDIITQRIKDKVWDDVARKEKPIPEIHEFKKSVILNQEKSKISLAEVYEQEYLKQQRTTTADGDQAEEESEDKKKIKKSMESLFAKLDALSNYHYTPKPAQAEVKIVGNIPAISMEEVAPVATSDAALLAPEEVKAKPKGDLMAKSERTDTDKKRERRKKKKLQRERQKEKTKKETQINPGSGNNYSKKMTSAMLDKITKHSKITDKMSQLSDGKALKTSKAFFTQLNEDVTSKKMKSRNKNNELYLAKKYKL